MQLLSHGVTCANTRLCSWERRGQQDKPVVVFFHGFPETHATWLKVMRALPTDWTLCAPDLPGYGGSDIMEEAHNYQMGNLIAIMHDYLQQLANRFGVNRLHLVAHDWGGAIAWPLTAFFGDVVASLTIINAAHPSTFTREMKNNPRQRAKSGYIHTLIAPTGATTLSANHFAMLKNMVDGDTYPLDEDISASYLSSWSKPNGVDAMLAYYRQMPQLFPADAIGEVTPEIQTVLDGIRIPNIRVERPTMVLWGREDEAFVEQVNDGLDAYVPDLVVHKLDDTSHWVSREKPLEVAQFIGEFVLRQK